MKRTLTLSLIMCSLLLTACKSASIGLIGGADGPTAIYIGKNNGNIKGQFGEQYEKKPVRMFNVDGDLYYELGLVSAMTPRCGTMDGHFTKTVNENEIPLKSGEANFEAGGYQHATSITKEVSIDGKWLIFKKYDTLGHTLDGLKYCYYIKGHLNNAAVDSEIIVLSQDENVTFNDVYEPLLSSQSTAGADNGRLIHNRIPNDKWGITFRADDVTPKGIILKIEQFGGHPSGELQTGVAYLLETTVNDEWQPVKTKSGKPLVWNSIAYGIKKNNITEMKIDWQYAYGELKPGFYRLSKEIMDFRAAGDYDKETYHVYFSIE